MFDQAVAQVRKASAVLLISHTKPDGDAIGAMTSLFYALDKLGKQVTIISPEQLPKIFSFAYNGIDSSRIFPSQDQWDLCVILDVGDLNRTGYPSEIKKAAYSNRLLCIDHHPLGDLAKLTDYFISDQEASSTAEICYELITRIGIKITFDIATSILLGIYTDTGGFQYSNTTPRTLDIASELMQRGARLQTISSVLSHTKTLSHLKLLGIALERLKMMNKTVPFSYSVITKEDLDIFKSEPEDLHGIINDINTLPAALFSLLLSEEEKEIVKGTLRSGIDSRYNVRGLARLLGGGGHPKAAGFTLHGSLTSTPEGYWKIVKPDNT